MKRTLLIIGAPELSGSLGDLIKTEARKQPSHVWDVYTAGIQGEQIELDITNGDQVYHLFKRKTQWTDVVCTVGLSGHEEQLLTTMSVNATFPLLFAMNWAKQARGYKTDHCSFVGISSNSATIARSDSVAYCASKAALSQGLRTLGRQYAKLGTDHNKAAVRIWGYEPGYLGNTPMSAETQRRYEGQPHRIPDPTLSGGLPTRLLARRIVEDIINHSLLMQATMQRIDAGDQ